MSIYKLMKDDWKTYCLMSAIMYIEEMNKPTPHIQIRAYKDKVYKCECFHTLRLKMKDKEFLQRIFNITRYWESKKNIKFIGLTFNDIKKDNYSGDQYKFIFNPAWLNYIMVECGKIPNEYSHKTSIMRINHLKQYKKIPINENKNLFNLLLVNKKLAAGAFIISFDLEFRGIQTGRPSLCMSEKYKDFLEFMLKVAQKWGWTENKQLSPVNVEYSRRIGVNASPQYEFRINMEGLKEIYKLAGPLIIKEKDKYINFHVNRSTNYKNLGGKFRKSRTKEKMLNELKRNKKGLTSTQLQFVAEVGIDVVLTHLNNLTKEGKVNKERIGKGFIWSIK